MRLGIQLYTLRNLGDSLPDRIGLLADTPYEAVEFAGLDGDTDAISAALDTAGVEAAAAHVRADTIEAEYDETLSAYRAVGCERLVVPSYEREAFGSEEAAREAGRRLADLADRLDEDGVELHYHNHRFEFTDLDDMTAFDAFADAAEGVGLELDVGLANHAGVDPAGLIERYAERVSFVHLTDSLPENEDAVHADLGDGTVDIEACVEAARDANVEYVFFEHGLTDDPLGSVKHAASVLGPLL